VIRLQPLTIKINPNKYNYHIMKSSPVFQRTRLAVVASLFLATNVFAQVLFEDDFNTDTSAKWTILSGTNADENDTAYDAALGDYTVDFAYDYSARGIPPAPNSTDKSTKGVRISVNNTDDTAGNESVGVNIFPADKNFSGNYALRMDMWINYNGPAYGGTGSTEHAIFGMNQSGEQVGWTTLPTGDGIWYGVDGEGGSSSDYYCFEADDSETVTALPVDLAGMFGKNQTHPVFQFLFPSPAYETQGAPGKHWVSVEIRQKDDVLTWVMNGMVIASRPVAEEFYGVRTEGTVMLGYMDLYNSIANPIEDNFVIYDNLRVVNLDGESALPLLRLEATDDSATESGDDSAEFTLHRSGNTANAATVDVTIGGTATEGVDYSLASKSITIPAGAESVSFAATPIDDKLGETEETIIVSLKLDQGNYEINHEYTATAVLYDDGDMATVSITATDGQSYERLAGDLIVFTITRAGDDSKDLAVTLKVGGSATEDIDYEGDFTEIEIFAFEAETIIELFPVDDTDIEGDETIEVTVLAGAGYAVGESATATAIIRDDDLAEEETLFADDFNVDSSSDWDVLFSAINGVEDYTATFAVDYSELSIPPAPHSTDESTLGLFLQVNKKDDTPSGAAGVNVLPKTPVFSGNYAVRFDMFLSAGSGAGTTEHALFGVNHSGDIVSLNAATGDGVWFGVVTDGSNNRSYASYVGAALVNSLPASNFATLIPTPPYISGLSFSGPGSPSSNGNQPDPVWADVEIRHVDGLVTLKVNQVPIFTVTDRGGFTEGAFMLGMNDQFSSIGSPETFVIYDNVRVVPLESEGGVTIVSIEATDSELTEGDSSDTGTVVVSREGPTDAALTVLLEITGDAQLGIDYAGAASEIVLPAGSAEVSIVLTSIDDDEVEAAESIRIDVVKSDAYFVGAAASAVVVLNDNDKESGPAPEPEVTIWANDLDSADATGWIVNKSSDDTAVTFGYDYSADGIPAAPNSDGSTLGIKLEANIAAPTGAEAVSISPVGGNFTGDYQLKFDMWVNANGPFPGGGGGSTEFFTAGVGTTGDHLQWASDSADGAWFGVTGEGGSGNSGDFRAHIGGARQAAESGAYAAGTTGDSRNNTNAHYADAFPGQSAPAKQAAAFPGKQTGALANGTVGFAWRQVTITKIGDSVTWAIDGVTIATLDQTLGAFTTEGNIFVGYYDAFSSVSDNRVTSFGLVDNLRVVEIISPLFGDNFDAGSSGDWAVHKSTDDTAVTFGYDYSADGIPAAPNSDGSTIGIKFEANIAAPTGAEAVSISPVGGNFTGDYQLNFDMWINANGPFPGGGGGSTEFFTAGVGTTGDHLQWASDSADGAWFGVTGEGGSGNSGDFRAHIGGARQAAESGAYAAGITGDSRNNTNAHYADAFPGQSPPAAQAAAFPDKQTGAIANGAVGFAWRQVSITKIGDSVTWSIDGVTIATLDQTLGAFTTEGNIFVGYYDAFSSVSDNRATSFGLVDNLRVVEIITPLYADNFDADSSGDWAVHKSTDDTAVTFGYDYSADGIPAAPNSDGTTIGVKLEANIAAPTGAEAVSISPVGANFTGDYEVTFDMWINANGPFPGGGGGSTEFFTAGVGTTGDHLQWASDSADGAWFGVTGEGGSGNSGDFRAHIGGARQAAESGAYAAGITGDSRNNTNAHYADAFPGQSPPAAQAAAFPDKQTGALANGAVGFAWRQVTITKIGDSVTWAIDGVTIATLDQSLGAFTTEGNIFIGYYDAFSSVSDNRATSFGLVDNLVVINLGAGDEASVVEITTINVSENGVELQVAVAGGELAADQLSLQSSASLGTAFADVTGATVEAAAGGFKITAPLPVAGQQFYRVKF
jgi:hypothetical protein